MLSVEFDDGHPPPEPPTFNPQPSDLVLVFRAPPIVAVDDE